MHEVEKYKVAPTCACLVEVTKNIFLSGRFFLIWAEDLKLHFFPEDATNDWSKDLVPKVLLLSN